MTLTSRLTSDAGSALTGAIWMLLLSVLLAWLPIVGPLIAGFVGGRAIGRQVPALGIAVLPAILMGVVLWIVLASFELPVLGAVAGFTALVVIAVQELPLLVGAWFGAGTESP